ncbi:hypothetical protein Ddye_020092 [Dipteronia dyeriana]|uniref:Uncharacterized protein n=1 Tax=Dipteronia dyeriana TaxID=168575 RepID=A0AAD9WWC6_9ROSI|nr:hypothetical protein Ddye_020092 [Dipteronia dyeriana]
MKNDKNKTQWIGFWRPNRKGEYGDEEYLDNEEEDDGNIPVSTIKHQQGIEIEHEDQGWSPSLLLKLEQQRRRNSF